IDRATTGGSSTLPCLLWKNMAFPGLRVYLSFLFHIIHYCSGGGRSMYGFEKSLQFAVWRVIVKQ
uniref:Uncharacterized protein n=1 Tax=Salmo trutta TaxID=8032 RepID=A0A673VM31_SALTR